MKNKKNAHQIIPGNSRRKKKLKSENLVRYILWYSKNFSHFSKLRAGGGGQPNNLFRSYGSHKYGTTAHHHVNVTPCGVLLVSFKYNFSNFIRIVTITTKFWEIGKLHYLQQNDSDMAFFFKSFILERWSNIPTFFFVRQTECSKSIYLRFITIRFTLKHCLFDTISQTAT